MPTISTLMRPPVADLTIACQYFADDLCTGMIYSVVPLDHDPWFEMIAQRYCNCVCNHFRSIKQEI